MSTIKAKQRSKGGNVEHLNPSAMAHPAEWDDIMVEVWRAQKFIKDSERVENPVLQERQRRCR